MERSICEVLLFLFFKVLIKNQNTCGFQDNTSNIKIFENHWLIWKKLQFYNYLKQENTNLGIHCKNL